MMWAPGHRVTVPVVRAGVPAGVARRVPGTVCDTPLARYSDQWRTVAVDDGPRIEVRVDELESWPTTGPDGWPLRPHGPGLWAAPCPAGCGHPLGEHTELGCEHFAAGHDGGRRVTLRGCGCSHTWHGIGGVS